MTKRVLYAGDTSLSTGAGYLAGVLTHFRLEFDYIAGDEPIGSMLAGGHHGAYVLSDYSATNFTKGDFAAMLDAVAAGAGLLMIGGWESFHGAKGEYHDSPVAQALPVEMAAGDDRVNCPQPCIIEKLRDHPIVAELPWGRPPCIGGYNRIRSKPDAVELLAARHLEVVSRGRGRYDTNCGDTSALLVLGQFGAARTAAFASDVAPHWVGGLVDWGDSRVAAQAPGAEQVEVGCHYAELFGRLVRWVLGELGS